MQVWEVYYNKAVKYVMGSGRSNFIPKIVNKNNISSNNSLNIITTKNVAINYIGTLCDEKDDLILKNKISDLCNLNQKKTENNNKVWRAPFQLKLMKTQIQQMLSMFGNKENLPGVTKNYMVLQAKSMLVKIFRFFSRI